MKIYRQGDVLLKEVKYIPVKQEVAKEEKVLAWGEVTGHKHLMKGKNLRFFQEQEQVFVDVPEKAQASVVHEEHAEIQVPVGKYEVIIQREFDLVEGIRQVMD